jgi:hypothetical protein
MYIITQNKKLYKNLNRTKQWVKNTANKKLCKKQWVKNTAIKKLCKK